MQLNASPSPAILVVTGAHPNETVGGAEIQAHLIAGELRRTGVNVAFCTWSSASDMIGVEKGGLPHAAIDKKHGLLQRMIRFRRIVRRYRPQVVYVRCLYSFWWIRLLSRSLGYTTVYHVSSAPQCFYETLQRNRGLLSRAGRIRHDLQVSAIRHAHAIICQSIEQKRLLALNLGRKAVVVSNGHPVPDRPKTKAAPPWRVLWIGKHWKHPEIFLALAEFMKDRKDVDFFMIGTFPADSSHQFRLAESRLPHFHFVGTLSNEQVNERLVDAHAMICTSDYEGFSNTFVQAWLHGAPVLSTGVNPDNLLEDKQIGIVAPTVEGMARVLQHLFNDSGKLFREYSERAYAYARANHDIKTTAAAIMDACVKTLPASR